MTELLYGRLFETGDIDRYRSRSGELYEPPKREGSLQKVGSGYTTIQVLPELVGTKLCNLSLALIAGLRPWSIRVTTGECTTDGVMGRVTVVVDRQGDIESVEMEVSCLYVSGGAVQAALEKLKAEGRGDGSRDMADASGAARPGAGEHTGPTA